MIALIAHSWQKLLNRQEIGKRIISFNIFNFIWQIMNKNIWYLNFASVDFYIIVQNVVKFGLKLRWC